MYKIIFSLSLILVLNKLCFSQELSLLEIQENTISNDIKIKLDLSIANFTILDYGSIDYVELTNSNTITLSINSLRFKLEKNHKLNEEIPLLLTDESGTKEMASYEKNVIYYKGHLENEPSQFCRFNIGEDWIEGFYTNANGEKFFTEPIQKFTNIPSSLIVLYKENDIKFTTDFICDNENTTNTSLGKDMIEILNPTQLTDFYVADILLDADYKYYLKNGSNINNTRNAMIGLLNLVEGVYENQVGVTFHVTNTHIWLTTLPVTFGSAEWLEKYIDWWVEYPKDLVHLFSGETGITGQGQGRQLICASPCNSGSFHRQNSTAFPNAYEIFLMSHEIGHVFGCDHVYDYTIMHSLGPHSNPNLSFNNISKSTFQNTLNNNQSCKGLLALNSNLSSDELCTNGQFRLDFVPSGSTQWSSSSNLNINQSGYTTKVSNGNGWVMARHSISNCLFESVLPFPRPSNVWELTKNLWVGLPNIPIDLEVLHDSEICSGGSIEFYLSSINPTMKTFNWLISGAYIFSGQGTNRIYTNVDPFAYSIAIDVEIGNVCGSIPAAGGDFEVQNCDYLLRVHPNPTENLLTIENPDKGIEFIAEIYNKSKIIVLKDNSIDGKVIFDISLLQPGMYFLNVYNNTILYKEQIIIN